jgi:hypothetical protein
MNRSAVAALGAVLIATIGATSAARAGVIDFGVIAIPSGPITYTGSFLAVSTALDLDDAPLLVYFVTPGDESGLTPFSSMVSLVAASPPPANIVYGSAAGPLMPENYVTLSWTGSQGAFVETLTAVKAIASDPTSMPDSISVTLTGTITGPPGSGFVDTPVSLALMANQPNGPGNTTFVWFTDATNATPAIPETSTWAMMALGFSALGYAVSRRRKTEISMLSA